MDRGIRAGWLLASKGAGGIVGCSSGSVGLGDNGGSFFLQGRFSIMMAGLKQGEGVRMEFADKGIMVAWQGEGGGRDTNKW